MRVVAKAAGGCVCELAGVCSQAAVLVYDTACMQIWCAAAPAPHGLRYALLARPASVVSYLTEQGRTVGMARAVWHIADTRNLAVSLLVNSNSHSPPFRRCFSCMKTRVFLAVKR